jgi:hypothetical protein
MALYTSVYSGANIYLPVYILGYSDDTNGCKQDNIEWNIKIEKSPAAISKI